MANEAECEARIKQYDNWGKLKALWEAIKVGDTPEWDSGKAFEYLVLQAFCLDGGTVRWPYHVVIENETVEQIDGFVHIGRFSALVESKDTRTPAAIAPIAKMRNQLLRRHFGAIGLVFSRAGFTDAAVILAKYIAPQAILLWSGPEVDQVFSDRKIQDHLEFKYQVCVETGMPDASIQQSGTPVSPAV